MSPESERKNPLVIGENLTRIYGEGSGRTVALDGASLRVDAGEIVAVVGPSGSGKSTLLHLIGAMDRPDEGSIRVDGRDLGSFDDESAARYRREEVGFVFQFFNLVPTLSALDNVALPARLAGAGAAAARRDAATLLERVGLADEGGRLPEQLSGGQQQRVAIARSLVNRPRILLADEPTGALDRSTGEAILDLLQSLVAERETTLFLATHSAEAMQRATRSLHITDGKLTSDTDRAAPTHAGSLES